MQEFTLITKESKWMELAVERALLKAPKFIQLATKQAKLLAASKKLTSKQKRLQEILSKLDLALDQTQDAEVTAKHRAIAGMLLMPHILGDNFYYTQGAK